jgi:uncharacterized protein YgiB involved in biofilm formation
MKLIVLLFISGVVGLMGYFALRGECPGSVVVMSEDQCAASGSVSRAACGTIFREADRVTQASATVFTDLQRCQANHDRCVPSSVTQGFAPVPAGFCVTTNGDAVTRQEPIYRRSNAPRIGGNS